MYVSVEGAGSVSGGSDTSSEKVPWLTLRKIWKPSSLLALSVQVRVIAAVVTFDGRPLVGVGGRAGVVTGTSAE